MEPNPLIYLFDDVRVELQTFRVLKAGSFVALEPKAFDVLVFLIEHRGRLVGKDELLDAVWKDATVTPNAMTRVIAQLRKAIGDDAKEARYIETMPTRGYRFIAVVEEVNGQRALSSTAPQETVETDLKGDERASPVPSRSRSATIGEAERKRSFSRWGLPVALLGGFGILTITAILIWKSQRQPASSTIPGALKTAQLTTWSGLDIYPALSPDGNSIAYSSDHSGGFEIYVEQLIPGARTMALTSDGEQNFQPAWSPDGQRIAYHSNNRGGIWIVPATGGSAKQLTQFGSNPAWSPDGSLIAFESYSIDDLSAVAVGALPPSTLWLVPAQGGDATPITEAGNPSGGHGSPSWAPDGKRIVFVAYRGGPAEMWTVAATGNDLRRVNDKQKWIYDPIYAPDGEHIYYGGVSDTGNFVLYQLRVSAARGEAIGGPAEVINTGLARIKHLTISADGKKMAYSAPMMMGSLVSIPISPKTSEATGPPESLTQGTSYRKGLPAFSPDGRKIAFTEWRGGTNQDIWVIDADGKNATQLTTDPAIDWGPSWFPDNDRIAFQSDRQGRLKVWSISLRTGREEVLIDVGQDIAWQKLSPDGTHVAFNSVKSGTINLWTASAEGGEPKQLTFDKEQMGWPCWSPDGQWLAFQMRRGQDTHIMIMSSGGGTPTQLTLERGQSWASSFSPDGDKISFAGERNGVWDVWWVSRTTKEQKRLTNYAKLNSYLRYPAWSPLGNQIVCEYGETTGNIWLMEFK